MTDQVKPSKKPELAPTARRCRFLTRAGASCANAVAYEDGGCLFHSQSAEALAKRREGRTKSAQGNRTAARAMRLIASDPRWAPLAERLMTALDEVMSGDLDSHRGMAISQLSRAMVQLVDQADAVAKLEAIERELAALREGGDEGEVFLTERDKPVEPGDVPRPGIPYATKGVN